MSVSSATPSLYDQEKALLRLVEGQGILRLPKDQGINGFELSRMQVPLTCAILQIQH